MKLPTPLIVVTLFTTICDGHSGLTFDNIGWFSATSAGDSTGYEFWAQHSAAFTLFLEPSSSYSGHSVNPIHTADLGLTLTPGNYTFSFAGTIPSGNLAGWDFGGLLLVFHNTDKGDNRIATVWAPYDVHLIQAAPDRFFTHCVGVFVPASKPVMEDDQYRITITDYVYNRGPDWVSPDAPVPDGYLDMVGHVSFTIESISSVPEPSTYLAGLSALGIFGMFGWRNRQD